jgi:hypothetical protein
MSESKANMSQMIATLTALCQKMALHIGVYQSIVGELPEPLMVDVLKGLNPAAVHRDYQDFIVHVREVATRLAAEKTQSAPDAEASRSPYTSASDAPATPQSAPDTQDRLPPPPAPSSLIVLAKR